MPFAEDPEKDDEIDRIIADLRSTRRYIDPYIIAELAKLKTELATHRNDRLELMAQDEKIIAEIRQLREDLNRMKGFVGGVAFVCSGIGVAAGLVISYTATFLKRCASACLPMAANSPSAWTEAIPRSWWSPAATATAAGPAGTRRNSGRHRRTVMPGSSIQATARRTGTGGP
jgi:hypothetical protein